LGASVLVISSCFGLVLQADRANRASIILFIIFKIVSFKVTIFTY